MLADIETMTGVRPRQIVVGAGTITVRTCLSEYMARQMAQIDALGKEIYISNIFDVPKGQWTNVFGLEEKDYVYKTRL